METHPTITTNLILGVIEQLMLVFIGYAMEGQMCVIEDRGTKCMGVLR